jgi:multiple sugar transport system substrate-binding protein
MQAAEKWEDGMTEITRRGVLGGVATAGLGLLGSRRAIAAPEWNGPPPEPGAQLRVLRWKQFIQAEFDSFVANTKKFVEKTGVKVRVDAESWDDIRPKSAVAANVGAGPDIIFGTLDDPFKFPDKLIDMTDLAEYLGAKYGGWYPVARKYGMKDKRWIALPHGATGGAMNYRISAMRAAGFDEFPKDLPGYLKLCQGLKRIGKPPGFALGHATGDANGWVLWLLWAHGGKTVDDNNNVVIDAPETVGALEYAKQLYATYIDGVLSWLDPSNNKAFLADQISLTLNGISIYVVAKNSPEPALNAIAADMNHANMPIGPIGRPTEQQNILNTYAYNYTKYPNAVREYLRFMWEKEQVDAWETASGGYVAPPLPAWNDNPVWTADPKTTPFRDVLKYALDDGYSGSLGYASAATMGDFIVVDMFAEACTGNQTPKAAAERAAERVKRYYQV